MDTLTSAIPEFLQTSYSTPEKQKEIAIKHGYIRDDRSNKNTQILKKKGSSSIIIHRGSQTGQDWIDDARIMLGQGNKLKRVKDGIKLRKKIESEDGMQVTSIGHSLGGYLAEKTAGKNAPVYTYNKHAIGLTKSRKNTSQVDISRYGDLASLPSLFQRNGAKKIVLNKEKNYLPPNPLRAHSIESNDAFNNKTIPLMKAKVITKKPPLKVRSTFVKK
jgi:hypothetical protein